MKTRLCVVAAMFVLLAGGRDKGGAFDNSAAEVRRRIKKLIVFGEAAETIERHWGAGVDSLLVAGMDEAIAAAREAASPGDVVLLSPACASFDQYSNYEARGEHFMSCVKALAAIGAELRG